jgi:inner membrane protein
MDSVTHTLFGLALYGAVDKRNLSKSEKRALLGCALVGSQIPDIDVISALWDTQGRYQMWHRGITHSLFLVPFWALLISALSALIFKVKGRFLFAFSLLAVFIHNTADIFNAWGTGYFEPFSSVRLTFGTTPIVDFVFWLVILLGFLVVRFVPHKWQSFKVYRFVWLLIILQVVSQSLQGAVLYERYKHEYEQLTLVADFIPTQFMLVGKKGAVVEMKYGDVLRGVRLRETLVSQEDADRELLFGKNKYAKTLVEWSPFVVWVEDERRIAVFDPRFYRNGNSFLMEEYLKPKVK